MSEDGHTWTFHIRPDARWQDGVPVTAHDVVFTFDLMGDPAVSRRDPVAALDTAFAPSSQDRIHEASWEIFRRVFFRAPAARPVTTGDAVRPGMSHQVAHTIT
jgi:ABC-type transport system substrate-binding protein